MFCMNVHAHAQLVRVTQQAGEDQVLRIELGDAGGGKKKIITTIKIEIEIMIIFVDYFLIKET